MPTCISRRHALTLGGSALTAFAWASPSAGTQADFKTRIGALEKKSGGRLGVAVLDTETGDRAGHRADERFALCSTFKFLASAFVLARVDRGEERLDRRVVFAKGDLVTYSPATEKRVGGDGMTVAEICEAAVQLSDNTAGNLLFASFGGPAGLTAYLRSLGDEVSRLDRIETELNTAIPGDPRDTTTPTAMLADMQKLLVGEALSPRSREQLIGWLVGNKTGDARLRAGLPMDWRVGDKTGTGDNGAANDVAIAWPPGRPPVLIAAYFAESPISGGERNAVLAEVGRIAAGSA
jgi:beta-lactamase class A